MGSREYTKYYIAFLDMLGFKKLISKGICEDICQIFDNIKKPFSIATYQGKQHITNDTTNALNIKIMSDSICFYIDVNVPNALLALITSCLRFQTNLFRLPKPILLRGAIVCGEMYASGDITFGPGLTQAYLMEERNAKYPRIILTNEVLELARQEDQELRGTVDENMTYRDFDAFYALNCLKMFLFWDEGEKAIAAFLQTIEQELDTATDESIREKYVYLERVLKEQCHITLPYKG